MIINQVATSYAELSAFVGNNKASIGRYLVKNDETNLGNPIEYYYDGTKLIVIAGTTKSSGGAGLPTILGEVATKDLIETNYTTPKANDGVIVTSDSTQSNRRTWYIYDGEAWIYKGLYKGDNTQEESSLSGTRGTIIAADTDYTLPNNLQYTVGASQMSIMINNQVSIRGVDWIEVGTSGVQSKVIQFKYAIPITANLVFRKDVSSTDLLYMQRNIDMDLIRKQTCAMMGVVYGGEIQYTTLREAEKVYWCNVNQKWYVPKFTGLIPAMTSNSQDGWILSHSSSAGGIPAYYLCDNVESTAWLSDYVTRGTTSISDASPEYIQIEKATPFHINAIHLFPLKNGVNNGSNAYSPKKITIQGYDGANWVDIVKFADARYLSYLSDGTIIPFSNSNSYYKYKILFQSHLLSGKYSIAFSALKIYSGKGSWTVADSDWELYDSEKTQRIVIDDASFPFVVSGTVSRNICSVEIDLCRLLTADFVSNDYLLPKPAYQSNMEISASNDGYMVLNAAGNLRYTYSVSPAAKRGWLYLTYPILKEERTYV